MKIKFPSKTDLKVWRFIADFQAEYRWMPTVREIAEGCGMLPGNVDRILKKLVDQGVLFKVPKQARTMRLLKKPPKIDQ